MSASGLINTLVWAILIIVIIIVIFLVAERLIAHLTIAPFAYATTEGDNDKDIAPQSQEQKEVDKETIDLGNDTEVTVTCTSNIPNLVSCD